MPESSAAAVMSVAELEPRYDAAGALLQNYSTIRLTIIRAAFIFNHMVEQHAPHLDTVFHALGDATRRRMLSPSGAANAP